MINFHRRQCLVVRARTVVWLLLLLIVAGVGTVEAQDEPPPRPTLEPTATPTSLPPTMAPTAEQTPDEPDDPTPEPRGRIIGTVIDLTTGAPAPNIVVAVGDAGIRTDTNGNYERGGLPRGEYIVQLQLTSEQGTPAQAPLTVVLAGDEVAVQHLAFYSVVQATQIPSTPGTPPPASPTATPGTPPPASSTATPVTTVIPTARPSLPPPIPTPTSIAPPQTLPGAGAPSPTTGWLVVLGSVLVALGAWQFHKLRHPQS